MLNTFAAFIQFFFTIVIGLYFFNQIRIQVSNKSTIEKESQKELEKLKKQRAIKLTDPLSEKIRPTNLSEVVGQENGIRALKAALCSSNPQHVIIYGPSGVGKTTAARIILEEAKRMPWSPFRKEAKFIEIDATTLRFDDKGIADPLIGSVHDPIYQGAGAYGMAGIPQPKPGAVTKAHGGILFIDEIGELHSTQMNKLLKVLEDRKVFFESAYYSSENENIPAHIHEIFQKGMPADFRLVGATTCSADEIPPALRSRCLEIYFRPLFYSELIEIAQNASRKGGLFLDAHTAEIVACYASNGREAVNIVQIAENIAQVEKRKTISKQDIEWIVEMCNYSMRIDKKISSKERIGYVNGLAVCGTKIGMIVEIEASAILSQELKGEITVTGVIDREQVDSKGRKLERMSCARGSIENVLTVMRRFLEVEPKNYDIHVNFPGGIPIDGPSAGVAIAVALYSSIKGAPIDGDIAITGELSIQGNVKGVGGVASKIEAAKMAGISKVIIPKDNWQDSFLLTGMEIIAVENIAQVMEVFFSNKLETKGEIKSCNPSSQLLTAQGR